MAKRAAWDQLKAETGAESDSSEAGVGARTPAQEPRKRPQPKLYAPATRTVRREASAPTPTRRTGGELLGLGLGILDEVAAATRRYRAQVAVAGRATAAGGPRSEAISGREGREASQRGARSASSTPERLLHAGVGSSPAGKRAHSTASTTASSSRDLKASPARAGRAAPPLRPAAALRTAPAAAVVGDGDHDAEALLAMSPTALTRARRQVAQRALADSRAKTVAAAVGRAAAKAGPGPGRGPALHDP